MDLVDRKRWIDWVVKVGLIDSCFYGQLPVAGRLPQGESCFRPYTLNCPLAESIRENLLKLYLNGMGIASLI